MGVTHSFVNPKSDGGDSTVTRPSDWNADHVITVPTINATLGGDVTIVNATTFYDGPSASFAAGTWLVIAQTLVKVIVTTSQTYAWAARIWDGSTIYAEGFEGLRSAGNYNNWAIPIQGMSTVLTLGGTTTLKISVECLRGSSASSIGRNETGIFGLSSNTGTRLIGVRLY